MAGTFSLIGTKLNPPYTRVNLVVRPRLTKLLNAGMRPECRLVLISAPAGSGKTTLASTWLTGFGLDYSWLSLEVSENEPIRFLTYLGAALAKAAPEFGSYIGSLASAPQLPVAETVAIELVNAIIPSPTPFFLVLDDYHAITSPYVHELINVLLQHLPLHFHLLLVTRVDPPFPLNRMRVRCEMTEVRMEDLCFTVEEAKEFLQTMGLDLSEEALASCTARIEGWAAGLQLAALSLQGRNPEEVRVFLTAFGGSHRYIIDYLVDEVLSRQDPSMREFLRSTAVLDRFTPQLCDEVTGRDDSREILRQIEADNLFLVPLDGERAWFRYHHLFADSLRAEIGKTERAEVHRRAAVWFEKQGDLPEAVKQALAAGEMTEAARLINEASLEMLIQSEREMATLRDWLEVLPDEILHTDSGLLVGKLWAFFLTGRPQEAVVFLAKISAAQRSAMPASNQGRLLSLEALIAGVMGDDVQAVALAQEALGPIDDPMTRASTLNVLGGSLARLGQTQEAELALYQAYELVAKTFPRAFITIITVSNLVFLLDLCGRRREAEMLCRRHYQPFLDGVGRPSAYGGILAVRLGIIAYEADELFEARLMLETGLELRRSIAYVEETCGEENLAMTLEALGEHEAAMETLKVDGRPESPEDQLFAIASVEAELKRRHGETAAAMRWAEEWRLSPLDLPNMRREPGYLTYIRLLLDLDRPAQALVLVENMAANITAGNRLNRLIPLRVLQALALNALGRNEEAVVILGKAVTLAAPEGYIRAFLDQGPAVTQLLPIIRDMAPGFVDRLSAAFKVFEADPARSHARLVEPLTEREGDLLKLLAEGLSNEEISRRLYISLNTTKWHLKSIFGKLAVGNRTQAVTTAREIGLI